MGAQPVADASTGHRECSRTGGQAPQPPQLEYCRSLRAGGQGSGGRLASLGAHPTRRPSLARGAQMCPARLAAWSRRQGAKRRPALRASEALELRRTERFEPLRCDAADRQASERLRPHGCDTSAAEGARTWISVGSGASDSQAQGAVAAGVFSPNQVGVDSVAVAAQQVRFVPLARERLLQENGDAGLACSEVSSRICRREPAALARNGSVGGREGVEAEAAAHAAKEARALHLRTVGAALSYSDFLRKARRTCVHLRHAAAPSSER